MKRCPYCAEWVQDPAIVCRYCNHEIPEHAKPAVTAKPTAMNSAKTSSLFAMVLAGVIVVIILAILVFYLVFKGLTSPGALETVRTSANGVRYVERKGLNGSYMGMPAYRVSRADDVAPLIHVRTILKCPPNQIEAELRRQLGTGATIKYDAPTTTWEARGATVRSIWVTVYRGNVLSVMVQFSSPVRD